MRAETRTRVLVVVESGSERHRKVRRVLMTPSSVLHEFQHRAILVIIWGEEERYQKTSSYKVWTHFSTSFYDMSRTHARQVRARMRDNVKFNFCKYCELSSGMIAATFQRNVIVPLFLIPH